MKFKVMDKIKVIKNVDEHKIGDKAEIVGFGNSYDYKLSTGGYINKENIKPVISKKKRIKKLKKEVAELKLIVAKIREPSNLIKEELLYNSEVIEFEGKKYKKVNRLAQIGDVVIFKKNKTHESYSTINKPYKVSGLDSLGVTFNGERTTDFNVYAPAHKRNRKNVVVYELITDTQSANEVK